MTRSKNYKRSQEAENYNTYKQTRTVPRIINAVPVEKPQWGKPGPYKRNESKKQNKPRKRYIAERGLRVCVVILPVGVPSMCMEPCDDASLI